MVLSASGFDDHETVAFCSDAAAFGHLLLFAKAGPAMAGSRTAAR